MVKMFLRRLDKRQKDIEIPSGKTVIGRGPLLGCADKKVSRNHAILDVHDGGKMDLLATHINPCFYQPQAKGEVRILKKDDKVHILPGDAIMLLRDSFKFKVIVKEDQKDINKKRTEGLNDQSSTQDLSKQLGYSSELDSDNSHEQERKKKKTETNDDEWNGHTSNKLGVLCRQDKVCEKLQVLKNETDVQISVENESGTQPCSVEENFPQLSAEKQSVSTPDVNKESVCLQGESTSLHPQNKTSIWGSSPKNEVTSPPQENISSERKRTLPSWLVKVTTSSEGKLGTQKPVPEIVQSDKSVEDRKGKRCVRKRTDSFHDSEFEDKGKECSRKYDSSSDSGGGQETYKTG
ncbi:uncharacterized protein LOC143227574 [Tachypleus tridentatus]|uniref:uncharacterized protein LOC143227574 n=1 Tax=Tachypleus tridentatus TaxID=6853 RepID=UPI003FCEFBC9